MYGIFGMEITKYTVIYGVYVRSWPTLLVVFAHPLWLGEGAHLVPVGKWLTFGEAFNLPGSQTHVCVCECVCVCVCGCECVCVCDICIN